jgi:membrane protease YdiL (CAAX protease family)
MARKVKSYDLFAAHGWYTPGVGGMFALLGWFLVGMLLGSVVQWIALAFVSQQTVLDYGMIVVYPIQFIPAMLYAARQSQRNALFEKGYALDSASFAPFSPWAAAGLTLLATVSGIFVFDLVNYANMQLTLRSPSLSEFYSVFMNLMKQLTGGPFWSSFLTVAIMAPIFEEWLCRGMVLRGLLVKMKPSWAIILSALFFALIHANPWQALNAFLIGVLMGYIYYKTGSLKLTMLIHFINNGTAVILSHIESLKEYDFWIDIFGKTDYMIVFCLSAVVLGATLWAFSRIPTHHPWGNMDPLE